MVGDAAYYIYRIQNSGGNSNTFWNISVTNCYRGADIANSNINITQFYANYTTYVIFITSGNANVSNFQMYNVGEPAYIRTSSNYLRNGIINSSSGNVIYLDQMSALNNIFSNITVWNSTGSSINILQPSDNGTTIIDMPLWRSYTLKNMTLTVENTTAGKIVFTNILNGTGANFSRDVQIGNNFAYVNSSVNGMNASANVTFYNLAGFSYPALFKDGQPCPASQC